jgi:hypothetical protein
MFGRDQPKMYGRVCEDFNSSEEEGSLIRMYMILNKNALFKLFCEWLIIEKDPGIVIPTIETVLHLLDTGDDTIDIVVTTQKDEGCVRSWVKRG